MKKFFSKLLRNDFLLVFFVFLLWRILLFVVSYLSVFLVPNYGHWFPYVERVLEITKLPPWLWGWGGFDGVHYLRIAQNGYDFIPSQAFFPLYPFLVRILNFLPKDMALDTSVYVDPSFFAVALLVSNVFALLAFYAFYLLVKNIFNSKTALLSLILLLSWPTGFYFGAIYTESLFLFLASLSVYFSFKKKFLFAGIFAAFASLTKVVGVCLFLLILIEFYLNYKGKIKLSKQFLKDFLGVLISPLGLISYMFYLWRFFGKPFYFVQAQPLFAAERSDKPIILLPQVVYRYFKIFIHTPIFSYQFNIALFELLLALLFFSLLFLFIRKMRFSYFIFTFLVLVIPTLTGTLTSMPRYTLTAFLIFPFLAEKYPRLVKLVIPFLIILQFILVTYFVRGYWVA